MRDLYDRAVRFAQKGDIESFFNLIVANPGLVKYKDEFGTNILIEIVALSDISVIKRLVEMGADVNLLDDEGATAMHMLVNNKASGNLAKIKLLIDSGFDLEIAGYNGWKPLHEAVFRNRYDVVELLLNNCADINSRTALDNEKTSLMIAAQRNSLRMVKFLVGHGADVDLKDTYVRKANCYAGVVFGWRVRCYLTSVTKSRG
ncbi:MAG: ankyrin repeat domain-containing protein [Gammaproteobacteria bacterium]